MRLEPLSPIVSNLVIECSEIAWIHRKSPNYRGDLMFLRNSEDLQFQNRHNAVLYLIGLATSLLGNNAMSLVAGIWTKSLTGSSAAAGIVSVCIYLPSLIGPIGGMVVDRIRRRPLLIWINLALAVVMLPLLFVHSVQQIWMIYLGMLAYGFGLIFIGPAENALFVVMLPNDYRQQINGWRLSLQEAGRLIAPLIGAGLFAWMGGGVVAALNAATFVVAALMTAKMRFAEDPPQPRQQHWREEVLAGFAHIRSNVALRRIVIAAAIVMAASGLVVASNYSLVTAIGEPQSFLGVLSAVLGAGSIAASLLSGPLLSRCGERGLVLMGIGNYVLGSLLMAMGWMPVAVIGNLVLGFALPWIFLGVLNFSQKATPDVLQGRVSAAITLALFGPQAPMQALGSLAIIYLSYRDLYIGVAIIAILTAFWLAFRKRHHTSREKI